MKSTGIHITGSSAWNVSGKYETAEALQALSCILPNNAILYFEGNAISKDVFQFFDAHRIHSNVEVLRGTAWPKSEKFHLKFTKEVIDKLCLMVHNHAQPELFDHFIAYVNNSVLISGYDFGDDPLIISEVIPEKSVQEFAIKINCKCLKVKL